MPRLAMRLSLVVAFLFLFFFRGRRTPSVEAAQRDPGAPLLPPDQEELECVAGH